MLHDDLKKYVYDSDQAASSRTDSRPPHVGDQISRRPPQRRRIRVKQNHHMISTGASIGIRKPVLVVAQQIELRARIARVLQSAGYAVELADGQKRAFELAAGGRIEAAIVINLPGLAQELRGKVPRTIGLGLRMDERGCHSLQASDALPVPGLDEQKLLDQLAQSKTSPANAGGGTAPAPVILRIKGCKLDLASRTFVDGNGREVQLTRSETALLAAFVGSPCRELSRDQLRQSVAGHGAEPYDRNVDMLVARLRRKIEPAPKAPAFILTVPGLGYKFAARPQSADHTESLSGNELESQTEARATWVNQSAVDEIMPTSAPDQVGTTHSEPARRQVTVLSCRLVGSVALATNLDPEDFGNTVRQFRDICTSVITQWGGAITHSVADEILALFGYPKSHEDDAERAVHAGLDLVTKVGEILSPAGEALQARIAIATSLVLVRDNQPAIGEAIVTAARLLNATAANSVMVSASTRKLVGGVFVCDDPQLCELEGASEPVTAYRVTGKRAISSRLNSRSGGKQTRFVGRQYELQQMSTLWERAKGGEGQVVLLCGEAGIGKSRVCRAWLDSIAHEPHITLRTHCSPYHTNSPFYPVIKQVEHAARFEREDRPEVKLKKLEAVLSQAGANALVDTPFFAALLSIPTEGLYSSPVLTPERQRDLTVAALVRQMLGLAHTRPVVLKIADAHWADSSTLELLGGAIASIKAARVFVVCTFRPEFFPRWLDESHVTMLRLDRLSREQTGHLISEASGGKKLPREVQEQIMSKADGVPLFAEELTKAVLESGLLRDAGDRYVTTASPPSLAIPATLLGSLTARLDRLGSSKEVAQIGAVIGREFSHRLIAAVAKISEPSLQSAIDQLATSGLISVRGEPPDASYMFKHALVQDAAYATMVRSKRQQLHGWVADALMAGSPETVDTQPELMAYHLAQAGLTEKAIEYLRKAGQRALEHSANAEAIGHLTRARELLQSLSKNPTLKHAAVELKATQAARFDLTSRYASA
jgi:class 3 adenylate cyclase/DNA-binding response OmpR family regulator